MNPSILMLPEIVVQISVGALTSVQYRNVKMHSLFNDLFSAFLGGVGAVVRSLPPNPKVPGSIPGFVGG